MQINFGTIPDPENYTLHRYAVKVSIPDIALPDRPDIITTFEITAPTIEAAEHRAYKMLGFIARGIIDEKNLNPSLEDGYGTTIEVKEI